MARQYFIGRPAPAEAPPDADGIEDEAQQQDRAQPMIRQGVGDLQVSQQRNGERDCRKQDADRPAQRKIRPNRMECRRDCVCPARHRTIQQQRRCERLQPLSLRRRQKIEAPSARALKVRQPDNVEPFPEMNRFLFQNRAVSSAVIDDDLSIDLEPRAVVRDELKNMRAGTIDVKIAVPPGRKGPVGCDGGRRPERASRYFRIDACDGLALPVRSRVVASRETKPGVERTGGEPQRQRKEEENGRSSPEPGRNRHGVRWSYRDTMASLNFSAIFV